MSEIENKYVDIILFSRRGSYQHTHTDTHTHTLTHSHTQTRRSWSPDTFCVTHSKLDINNNKIETAAAATTTKDKKIIIIKLNDVVSEIEISKGSADGFPRESGRV